jgi:hypothetical protein
MKHKVSVLEEMKKKDEILIKQYLGAITWERIYFIWKETLESFSVEKDNIFLEIESNNSELICGTLYFSWWEKNKMIESKKSLLKVIESIQPFTLVEKPTFDKGFRGSEIDTLKSLWELKHDPEKTAALLLHASLFTRIESSRAIFPSNYWPPHIVLTKLSEMIDQVLGDSITKPLWWHSCTKVIPIFSTDTNFKIDNVSALIHYFALEHCKLLSKYQPVRISNISKLVTREAMTSTF